MTKFSLYSFRFYKISQYINLKKFFVRILAPPSGRRPRADAPPCPPPRYATANGFNNFFVSIGPELAKGIHSHINPLTYVNNISNSIAIFNVSCEETLKIAIDEGL